MENERKQIACPKCGKENPADAQFCDACGGPLTQASPTTQRVSVKVSRLAIASFIGALCGLVLLSPSLFAVSFPRVLSPRQDWIGLTFLASLVVLAASCILGLIGIVQIERSGGRKTGELFAVGAVLISVIGGLLPAWSIVIHRTRGSSFRMVCGTNLACIGKAMLIYSNDYDDAFPRAGGKSSVWVPKIPDWQAANRFQAYGLNADGTGGQATISSSLYLLVKYADVEPNRFVCPDDRGITQFRPRRFGAHRREVVDLWDFGAEPWKHYSFSYHNPYGPYALTTARNPSLAAAADRNPWMASPFVKARDFGKFNPGDDWEAMRASNAVAHKYDGQNVLFLDGHVNFERNSFCGINDDNIYTSWDDQDIRRGVPPKLGSQPADRLDSLLVNDPPAPR
jgi:prepilin-type processing-associated H-X9-DG protein